MNIPVFVLIAVFVVGFGWVFWTMFSPAPACPACGAGFCSMIDINESFYRLRVGDMTEEDEANLRNAAEFERMDRHRTETEIDLEIVENEVNREVRRV